MEVQKLCKSYGGRPVLQNVSFTAETGVTALWGPSGAGKTTLLRILMGLEVPDSGTLSGTDVRWSAVFQEDRLLPGLDAMENLRFVLGPNMDDDAAAAQLRALGLDPSPGQRVRSWSGGMRRRLALARALLPRQTRWRWTSPSPDWTRKTGSVRQRASPKRRSECRCCW